MGRTRLWVSLLVIIHDFVVTFREYVRPGNNEYLSIVISHRIVRNHPLSAAIAIAIAINVAANLGLSSRASSLVSFLIPRRTRLVVARFLAL